jgi:2,3-bisphosphoglycerate-dependent phosphoglycerate mutase
VDPESLADRGTLEASFRSTSTQSRFRRSKDLDNDSFIVMIRHGRTEYNKLGIFTGWEDAPLAKEGRSEARAAGKVLKLHGIEFDIVYTSWLSRAIETAWLVLDELDCLWLPIVKTWRLNERMYGALTGLSKKMIAQKHGDKQFKKWRRGYDQRPPQVSSFSSHYPGNDDRYQRYATDVRFSAFESIVRTLAHKRLELHRKFPKTESLQDCMRRTIPFFTGTIMPKSVKKGKTVLIASSENAIRGLLMHLCGIPEDRISEVEIPTGLPLVYSFRSKKIRLLEDGTEDPNNPLGNYNFGSAPELLFNACPEEGEVFTEDNDQCFFFPDGTSYAYDPLLRLEHAPTEEDIKAVKASSDNSALEGKTAQEDKERAEAATLETGGSGI